VQVICEDSSPKASRRRTLLSKAWSRRSSWPSLLPGEKAYPRIAAMVKSHVFEIAVGIVILFNCSTMGLEAELLLGNAQAWRGVIPVSEHIFTVIFLLELILRTMVYGWRSFVPGLGGSVWNCLDAALVLVTGVIAVWVLPAFEGLDAVTLQTLTVLRALRLVRLVRVVSRVEAFKEVWLLLRGLAESVRVLFWTIVVIFFITYMFAIFGVVLISVELKREHDVLPVGSHTHTELEYLTEVTGSVTAVMYTLLQVLTLDSWTSVARPIMRHIAWSWMYFYIYICIAVFVLMNLVTAIIVENALKNSQKDAEELLAEKDREREQAFHQVCHLFKMIDGDGNGELSKGELEAAFEDPEIEVQLRLLNINREDCKEIFDLIDTGDGVLSVQEFFDGIRRMEGAAQARDLFRVLKTAEQVARLVRSDVGETRSERSAGACQRQRSGSGSPQRQRSTTSLRRSASPLPCGRLSPRLAASGSKQHRLDDIARKLDDVLGALSACNRRIDACSQKVGDLAGDLGDLRSCMDMPGGGGLEHQQSLSVPRDECVRSQNSSRMPIRTAVGRVTKGIVT